MRDYIKPVLIALVLGGITGLFSLWQNVIELRVEVRQLQRDQAYYHGQRP